MSGLEVIPIATGIVCAVAAVNQIVSRKKGRDGSKARYFSDDEDYDGKSRFSRRSRSRGRSYNIPLNQYRKKSRSRSNSKSRRRSVSLSRDSPAGWTFMYKSRSKNRLLDRRVCRSRSRPRRSRSRTHTRQESRTRREKGPSPEHGILSSGHRQPLRLSESEAGRITGHRRHNPVKKFQLCKGKVVEVKQYRSRDTYAVAGYTCTSCHYTVADSKIATWHNFLPKDQGEVWLHRDFILQHHARNYQKFHCIICGAWVTEIEQLVRHFTGHRYAELRGVIPATEWKGSLG